MPLFRVHNKTDIEPVKEYLDRLTVGKTYDVSIKLHRDNRSLPQNRLYRLWLNCISNETGNEVEDLHDYFRGRFLSHRVEIFGGECSVRISTKRLNTAEFTAFLDKVQQFAAEQGIILPNPEDLYFEQFYQQYKDFI
jgi:hypothetical protein